MFSPMKNGPFGRKSACKKCNSKYAAQIAANKKAEKAAIEDAKLTYPRIPDHMKQCKYCLEVKLKEGNFRKRRGCAGGVAAKCNTCFNKDRPSRSGSKKTKEFWRKYYAKNKDRLLESQRNSEKKKIYNSKRYTDKAGQIREAQKEYRSSARGRALHARSQSVRNRRLSKAQPNWLTDEQIEEMNQLYWLAQDLKVVSDKVYHVDHIVPLMGKTICGLHVPWNLQILPADMNIRKSNKMET